jgi:hypothetical protein
MRKRYLQARERHCGIRLWPADFSRPTAKSIPQFIRYGKEMTSPLGVKGDDSAIAGVLIYSSHQVRAAVAFHVT